MRAPHPTRNHLMSVAEEKSRPDLAALKIHRDDDEHERRSFPIVKIVVWIVVLAAIGVAGFAGYQKYVLPRSAPVAETLVIKPMVNVAHPPLLAASGYLVANKQSKITPKISGK